MERWLDRHGFEAAEAWARFNNAPAPLTLRVNRLRTTPDAVAAALAQHGVRVEPGRFVPDALVVLEGNPLLTPLAGDGSFFVQDEASQVVASLVGAQPGERILDACASPGGKTTAMAAAMGDRGLVVATDLRGRRVELLARTVAASGARSIQRAAGRRRAAAALSPDVRCRSARRALLGPRRHPAGSGRQVAADGGGLRRRSPPRRRRLLDQAAAVLRPGGRLDLLDLLERAGGERRRRRRDSWRSARDFRAAELTAPPGPVPALLDRSGRLRTLPHRDGLESFFAAALVKTADPQ